MKLRDKTILIISPERWGKNMLSKHHYALSLSRRGNKVFFLPPPVAEKKNVTLHPAEGHPEITVIEYSSSVIGLSKLPAFITDLFARVDAKRITSAAGNFDVIWNFDMYRFQNPKFFHPQVTILHPVDFINSWLELRAARHYDYIFSVSQDILDKFKGINDNLFFINHGLSEHFVMSATLTPYNAARKIQCGYVGNLLSFGIHHQNLMAIIEGNPDVTFHFIGPKKSSNLGHFEGTDITQQLEKFPNAVLHGEMHPTDVAKLIQSYDLFLICYNPEKVGKIASNNHKILEYLSTGKVVVSSRISTYDQIAEGLFIMTYKSEDLLVAFANTISNINHLNTIELQEKRRSFAQNNTYEKQIERIESIINN